MAKQKLNKNVLPLLAVTALLLSVSLANYNDSVLIGSKSTQGVLSESDENKDESEKEKKEETKMVEVKENKEKEKKEVRSNENRTVEASKKVESTKRPEVRELPKRELQNKDDDRNKNDQLIRKDESEVSGKDDIEKKQEVESEFEQEVETKSEDDTVLKFKLKTQSKVVNGKTIVETSKGEVEVENNPEDTVNELVTNGVFDTPVAFEAKTEDDKVKFEFKGVESKRIFGLFKVELPKTVTVDADTGEVISDNQTVWTRFLSLISN